MNKRGRKSKYETHVQPFLEKIAEMSKELPEYEICDILGVSTSAWSEYKNDFSELKDAIKKGQRSGVAEVRGALKKKAIGFEYEEKEYYTDDNGNKRMKKTIKYAQPDVAAINLYLKNYDKENWSNDPQALELRRKELELREKQIEANNW